MRGWRKPGGAVALCVLLSGCVTLPFGGGTRPAALPATPPAGAIPPRSAESMAVQAYYRQVEETLVGRGLLRQDVAPRDAPFAAHQLVENFVHIALYDEYTEVGGRYVAAPHMAKLRRWAEPVRIGLEFGTAVPQSERQADSAMVSAFAGQLAQATGHPVRMVDEAPNFAVLVVNEDERRALGPRLQELVPGIDAASVSALTQLSPATFCVVFAFSEGASPSYNRAVAIIRAEHPERLRRSCIHEELAQGMGLANDFPRARPSIFNDDEEFALLTRHDELLLQMLYDKRLRPGMLEPEARPILQTIAAELLGANS